MLARVLNRIVRPIGLRCVQAPEIKPAVEASKTAPAKFPHCAEPA